MFLVRVDPGGRAILAQFAGKVCDEEFDANHTMAVIDDNLSKDKILGRLPESELSVVVKEEKARPPVKSPLRFLLFRLQYGRAKTLSLLPELVQNVRGSLASQNPREHTCRLKAA